MHNPDAVYEHHALRIAAKKLRYTLETYAPLYRRGFTKPIARIKKVQDLLGDIHDCDVWIEQMTMAIIKQHTRRHPVGTLPGAAISAVAPLRRLLSTASGAGCGSTGSLSGTGIPLSAPGSVMPCGLRHWKGRKQHSAIGQPVRQKGNARHSCGLLLPRPIMSPTA